MEINQLQKPTGEHIIDGEFQSDKYPTCPRGKVPLSTRDGGAQDLLWIYAQRRRKIDAQFSDDLEACLRWHAYSPTFKDAKDSARKELVRLMADEQARRWFTLDRTADIDVQPIHVIRFRDFAEKEMEMLLVMERALEDQLPAEAGPEAIAGAPRNIYQMSIDDISDLPLAQRRQIKAYQAVNYTIRDCWRKGQPFLAGFICLVYPIMLAVMAGLRRHTLAKTDAERKAWAGGHVCAFPEPKEGETFKCPECGVWWLAEVRFTQGETKALKWFRLGGGGRDEVLASDP